MSIISALYSGVSGMAAMGKALQVTSNNIANVNTVGFKESRSQFADLLAQAINTPAGKKQVGRGVRVESVEGLFHQGSFESTPIVTDVALNGSGYFVVTDGSQEYFTRAGQFRINKDGELINALGMNVSGYNILPTGQMSSDRGPIDLSSVTSAPNPTGDGVAQGSGVRLNVNLHPTEADLGANGIKTFDLADPSGTSNFSTAVTIYDSLGAPHTCTIYFNKTADNQWDWHGLVDGGEVTGGTSGTMNEAASGSLQFDVNGQLTNQTSTSSFDFVGGAAQGQVIGFDFGTSTQLATPSVTNSITQDGYAAGALQAIDIGRDGTITGVFNNGQARPLARLTVASFAAESNLFRVGNSLFIGTQESGQPVYSTANTGTNGTIASSTLELSNVDLTEQFVQLITTQRSFQANTKVVTTGDEMLETVIGLKR